MPRTPQIVSRIKPRLLKPLQLTEVLSGSVKSRLTGICFNEISSLFLCLKNSGFNESACPKEISNFQKCYNSHYHKKFSPEPPTPGKSKATPQEINKLLKKFPNIKER